MTAQRTKSLDAVWNIIEPSTTGSSAKRLPVPPFTNEQALRILKRGISSKVIEPLPDYLAVGKGELVNILDLDRTTLLRRASKDQPLPTHCKRVHCNGAMPKNMALMRLEIPASAALPDAEQWAGQALAADWRQDKGLTRSVGMQWLDSQASPGLWVPSYVQPAERNLLLNPAHPDYLRLKLVCEKNPFVFDPRLFIGVRQCGLESEADFGGKNLHPNCLVSSMPCGRQRLECI